MTARWRMAPPVVLRGPERHKGRKDREARERRPLEPKLFAQVETRPGAPDAPPEWAIYLTIERAGQARRVAIDVRVAVDRLREQLEACERATAAWQARLTREGKPLPPFPAEEPHPADEAIYPAAALTPGAPLPLDPTTGERIELIDPAEHPGWLPPEAPGPEAERKEGP